MRKLILLLVVAWGASTAHAQPTPKQLAGELAKARNRWKRATIITALRHAGPQAYPAVVRALKAKDAVNRRAAAMLLAEFARKLGKAPGSPKALVRKLTDGDALTRDYLVSALSWYGKKPVGPLLKMLKNRKVFAREAAGRALAAQGATVVKKIVALLDDEEPRAQLGAMHALGWFDDPGAVAFARMQRGLGAADPAERAAAAFGMRGCKAQRAQVLPLLAKALRDKNAAVAGAAGAAVTHHGKEGVGILVDALGAGTETQEFATERALIDLGEGAADLLAQSFSKGTPQHRAAVARVLGAYGRQHGFSSIANALREGLGDKDARVRTECARALRIIALDAARLAIKEVVLATKDRDVGVRAAALFTLTRLATEKRQLREPADRASKHHDPRLRAAGAFAQYKNGRIRAGQAVSLIHLGVIDPNLAASERADALSMMQTVPGGVAALVGPGHEILNDGELPGRLRAAAAVALGGAIAGRGAGFRKRTAALAKMDASARSSIRRALDWLERKQSKEKGPWPARELGAEDNWDVGITAMSTLAFLGAGRTDEPVRKGLEFLASMQKKTGEINQFSNRGWTHMCEHAWATLALCEAVDLMDDKKWRPIAQAAVRYCEKARNPYMAWRYKARGGENDTHITALMAQALRVAAHAGLDVDRSAWEGARQWIDKMTDPNFGQVGYNFPGGPVFRGKRLHGRDRFPAEKSQSMTAAGILVRMMLGEDPRMSEMIKKGARLCLLVPPDWNKDSGSIDMYYWHFASLAMVQIGGPLPKRWRSACQKTLVDHQDTDGSWAPVGAWGITGGRGYSTAIGALTLLAPIRYPSWQEAGRLSTPMSRAYKTLKRAAAKDPSPIVRAAARRAAKKIERSLP